MREELARAPDSVDHLRLLGRALAMQSRASEAEEVVRRALALAPSRAALHEDLGGILAMQGRFEDAVSCFETALKSDPRLPFARKKLGEALAALGRGPEADKAFEGWFEQDSDRVYVAVALDHLQAGRRAEGISNLRKAIKANPDNVDALYALAQAYRGNEQRNSDIEAMLRRVNEIAPAHVAAWALLGALLHETDRTEEAIACYLRVVELEPANVGGWSGLGAAYARIGNVAKGAEAYKRSIVLQPDLPGTHMSLAHELKTLGKQAEALREYRAAIALKPDFGEAYWSMANLKVFRFEPAEVTAMEEQLKREDLSESANVHFRFALGKAYEDAGDYDRAWEYYETGNQRQRPLVSYDPVGFESRHEEIAEVFSREFLEQHAGEGFESDAPIFIVGLPRSGSTLIEQILSSHSQVEGTLELATLGKIAVSTGLYRRNNREYPGAVRELRNHDFRAFGKQYIEETQVYRTSGKPRFTDKLPNNFSHVGFVHLILPNAKIINARRHPLDSLLGSYKQLFGKGQNFTYDVHELGAVLPAVPRDHEALAPRAAGQGARRALRGNGRRPREAGASDPRALRTAVRGGVPAFSRDRARGQDREFRAGTPAAVHARARHLAPVRKAPRTLAGGAGRRHRRAAGKRPERRALVGPDLEAVDGVPDVHRQVDRQRAAVPRRGRRP